MNNSSISQSLKLNRQVSNNKRYFYWIDWLRFLSALIVLLSHLRGSTFLEYGALTNSQKTLIITLFYAITRLGSEAVIVFFVLSGFLVGGKSIERITTRSFKPINYTIDRLEQLGSKLAAFSYTLYLTHMPIKTAIEFYFKLNRAGSIELNSISIFILKIFVCIVLALLLYWLCEKRTTLVRDQVTTFIKAQNLI